MSQTTDFEEIYRSNIALVRKIIRSFKLSNGTADDLAQQVFLKAFEKLPTLRDSSLVSPWIASIARNCCLQTFRAKTFVTFDEEVLNANEFTLGLWFDPESGEADLELEQNLNTLYRLLHEYRKEPRGRVARLFYIENKTTREIAEELQISQNTVLSHLLLFRKEMKAALVSLSALPL